MSDDTRRPTATDGTSDQEAALGRLLRLAGPRETADDERVARVRAAVHEAWSDTVRAQTRRRWFALGGLSLATAVAAFLLVVMWRAPRGTPAPAAPPAIVARLVSATGDVFVAPPSAGILREGDAAAVGAWLRTPDRALATFALEGGGELRLDAGTSVRLAGERRLALDRGAIYVDSGTSRGGAPVSIETPAGTVRDVGTRFEVRLLDRVLRVRVREGAVRLERAGVQRDASAGTELTTTPGGAIGERAIPAYDEDWAWTVRAAPSFRVEGRTLETFLDWVSREGGWTVTFADPAIEQSARTTILHGSIEGLTTDEALAVILPACGLTYRIDTGHVVVDRPPPPAGGS